MRKAFDANVPKLKPRLKLGAPAAVAEAEPELAEVPAAIATPTPSPRPSPPLRGGEGGATSTSSDDVLSRKERLDKIKRRVAEAARPSSRAPPIPADPARAAESVLGLVRDLETELVRAREREEALRGDLEEVRRELGRAAGDGRSAVERLAAAEKEVEERRGVLRDLLGEMQGLEEERDASVRRAQALATLDEERARLLEELGRRADEESRLRAEGEVEVERLSEELRLAGADGARLRAAVGELARERDQLGADLERTRRERDALAEAKQALEAVHTALAQARARIG